MQGIGSKLPATGLCYLLLAVSFIVWVSRSHAEDAAEQGGRAEWAVVVHGGAGGAEDDLTDEQRESRERSLRQALDIGKRILNDGGTSLDAVEQVIRHLEDDPQFNAGRGAVLNATGEHQLDASIMDGKTKACGAVGAVTLAKNPISVARLVMTKTRHVLLVADGADEFARQMEVAVAEPEYFRTDERKAELRRIRARQSSSEDDSPQASSDSSRGTVGCVALDRHGNLAAGTSTGGLVNKQFGRVGDSPIIGAGTYADNATCAVSCTGVGEHYIRHAVAHDVSARMAYAGQTLEEAVQAVLHKTLKPGDGGMIAVDHRGNMVMDFNTPGMARAAADANGQYEVQIGKR